SRAGNAPSCRQPPAQRREGQSRQSSRFCGVTCVWPWLALPSVIACDYPPRPLCRKAVGGHPPTAARAARHTTERTVLCDPRPPRPTPPRRVEPPRNLPQSTSVSAFPANPGDDCLLVLILDQQCRIGQVRPPAVRAAVRAGHAATLRLMPQHGGRCPLRDLL